MRKISLLLLLSLISFARGNIQFSFRKNPYATHQPVLYELANSTAGPIIEFGCGDGSTSLLHEICKTTGRLLISIDDNFEWLSKFSNKYLGDGYVPDNSGWHKFYFVPGKVDNLNPDHWVKFWEESEWLKTLQFSVCFIDQSPWLARYETVKRLKAQSTYIVVHDCDYFAAFNVFGKVIRLTDHIKQIAGIYDYSDMFQNFKVYFPPHPWPAQTGPPTLVGTDFESDLPEIDYTKY